MIALYLNWSGEPLAQPLAERLAASLGLGTRPMGVRHVDGAVLVGPARDKVRARAWMPARAPNGGSVLFSGHISNRSELQANLPSGTRPAADDAELYGQCHAAWGDDADRRIIGEYAAVVWLAGQRTVRLSRSPIQAPPLHVWHDEERLIVASTPRAIFATGEVEREIDEQKLADSLVLNYREGQRGWFKGVSRVLPGSRQTFCDGRATIDTWYDPAALPEVRLRRDEDYVEAAKALFAEGVGAALQGFHRPAISLSGGIDSQAVAVGVIEHLDGGQSVDGFTSVPEAGWDGRAPSHKFGDERPYVAALAAMYPRLRSHLVDAAGLSFEHQLDAMFMLTGSSPRNAMNMHWIHEVRRQARSAGCDVMLTGAFGNVSFSFEGLGYLPHLLLHGRLVTLWRELGPVARRLRVGVPRAFASQAVMPVLPDALYRTIMRWRHGLVPNSDLTWCPINPAYAAEMRVFERATDMGEDPLMRPYPSTRANRIAMLTGASHEGADADAALEALWNIPTRDPTAYRPLLEFCLGIPDDQYVRNGTDRWLARRMFAGRLPAMVLDERRRGLQGADWHVRLSRQREDLMAELERLEADPAMAYRLDLPRLRATLEAWPSETPVDDPQLVAAMQWAVSRGLTGARYVRYFEGRND
jgi:asparagine synthase (glutamine-hydrolysing)